MKADRPVRLKVTTEGRDYIFICEDAAPLGHTWDALMQMTRVIADEMAKQQPEVVAENEEVSEQAPIEEVKE